MLSTDKNVETIASLVEQVKEYAGLQAEYLKLGAVEKTVKLFSALIMSIVLALLLLLFVIFLSLCIAHGIHALASVPLALAYLIVAFIYLLVFLLAIIFRRQWIERPLVRFLAGVLMEKNE